MNITKVPELEQPYREITGKRFPEGPARKALAGIVRNAPLIHGKFRLSTFTNPRTQMVTVGGIMEDTAELLKLANDQVSESRQQLEELTNQVKAIAQILQPELMKQVREVRDARNAIIGENKQILVSMQNVRDFFFEKDYDKEMERLERFVGLCKEIERLHANGTLEVIGDLAIRLATKETKS